MRQSISWRRTTRLGPLLWAWAPWVVVLLGVAVLVTAFLYTLFVFVAPPKPRPVLPARLPAPPAIALSPSAAASQEQAPATPSPIPTTSRSVTTSRPAAPPATSPLVKRTSARPVPGKVTALYRVLGRQNGGFRAELTVANESQRAQDWNVAMVFPSPMLSISTNGPALSVLQSNGNVVLRSTAPLGRGESATVSLVVGSDEGSGVPSLCSVNDTRCSIG